MSQRILDDQLLIPSTVRSESKQRLQDALARLGGTDAGRLLLDAIRGQGATLHFGPTGADVTYFDFARNEIVVDEGLADTSTNVLVQHLAHEGVHAQWGWPDSIEQEYQAYRTEAEIWNLVKGNETDEQCDLVSEMIVMGEKGAKWIIENSYPELSV